jgi:hypothetical protein
VNKKRDVWGFMYQGLLEQYNLEVYCLSVLDLGTKNCHIKTRVTCEDGLNNNTNNNNNNNNNNSL